MIRIREIDHLVLRTEQPETMIAFYTEVLGMSVERHLEDIGLIQLRAGRSLLDFDETAIRDRLKTFGVEAGPTVQRYGAEGTGPSIYIQDPDGNTVELKGPADPLSHGA
jgi:catechol 2,3-dioxygenase-like lactoylglutathione lyase family enzyme